MVARFAGAGLGFLAFTITALAGLFVQNPVTVTLSRSLLALFVFGIIGLVLGTATELVVREYKDNRESEIRKRYNEDSTKRDGGSGNKSNDKGGLPIGT